VGGGEGIPNGEQVALRIEGVDAVGDAGHLGLAKMGGGVALSPEVDFFHGVRVDDREGAITSLSDHAGEGVPDGTDADDEDSELGVAEGVDDIGVARCTHEGIRSEEIRWKKAARLRSSFGVSAYWMTNG